MMTIGVNTETGRGLAFVTLHLFFISQHSSFHLQIAQPPTALCLTTSRRNDLTPAWSFCGSDGVPHGLAFLGRFSVSFFFCPFASLS